MQKHPHLQGFGKRLQDPNLWHLNRRSVSGAVAVGLFCALLPVPGQMFLAAALAIWARVNLPVSVVLIFATNPLTMPPVFYGTYKLGAWIMDLPPKQIDFELSIDWLISMQHIWKPLFLGSLVAAVIVAALGFVLTRLIWRLHIINRMKSRFRSMGRRN